MCECLTLELDASQWLRLAQRTIRGEWNGEPLDQWRRTTRRELGIPVNPLVIATGHQAGVWHPGILAKYLAAAAFTDAAGEGAVPVHLVVDQDQNAAGSLDVPVVDSGEALARRTHRLLAVDNARPTGERPASAVIPPGEVRYALPSVGAGVDRVVRALDRHRDEPSGARQGARAVTDLMERWVSPMTLLFASDLLTTTFGTTLLREMRERPERCVAAYNRAVSRRPATGIRPLTVRGEQVELPVWRLDDDGRRHPAYAMDLDDDGVPDSRLRPRALLMTAIMRLAVSDLFIHGRGGRGYDAVMEAWIADWLDLAPAAAVMAAADLRLPLAEFIPEAPPLDEAIERVRHCWHDPPTCAEPGGVRPSDAKRAWLERIAAQPSGSLERRRVFYDMHEWLEAERAARAHDLDAAREEADRARQAAAARAVASRRDWAFPLYPEGSIDRLAEAVRAAFGEAAAR